MTDKTMPGAEPDLDGAPDDTGTQLPIPDGGLGGAMPEWLQRPPAWSEAAPAAVPSRTLPPPDTSPIDPRTMLDIGDLPGWLQRIAARSAHEGPSEPDTPPPPRPSDTPPQPAPAVTGPAVASTVPGTAGAATSAVPSPAGQRPPVVILAPSRRERTGAPWRSRPVLAGAAILVVLIALWIVLVAL